MSHLGSIYAPCGQNMFSYNETLACMKRDGEA